MSVTTSLTPALSPRRGRILRRVSGNTCDGICQTIIHKSNVLSITDGLFRETVRGVPQLPEVNGKYNDVTIAEQLVDSAVYR